MVSENKTRLFESSPVPAAVFQLAIPAIIGQTITIIYNLADTFFVGQLNDNNQVAAVTLCMPIFLALTALSNMFGVGGGSLLSQSLGAKKPEKAKLISSLSFWSGIGAAVLFSLLVLLFRSPLLNFVGANMDTYQYCIDYLTWTVVLGGVFTTMNPLLGYLVRSEGNAFQASIGIGLGGILNILLDPLLIFGLHLGVKGAAMATCFSNIAASLYFLIYIARQQRAQNTHLSLRPQTSSAVLSEIKAIITIGMPSFFLSIMSTVSNVAVTRLISPFGSAALAGIGVAKKVNSTAFSISQGLGQGILPLVAYNYSSGNTKRMKQVITFSLGVGCTFAMICVIWFRMAPENITAFFIKDPQAVALGASFLRIICFAIPTTTIVCLGITAFQSVGQKKQPFLISIMRKGTIDVTFMIILRKPLGMYGIVWATPIAECCTVAMTLILLLYFFRSQKENAPGTEDLLAP